MANPMIVLPQIAGRPDQAWRRHAACRGKGPDLFYSSAPSDVRAAKAICAACPVRNECSEENVAIGAYYNRFGVWAGTTETERRQARARKPDLSVIVEQGRVA